MSQPASAPQRRRGTVTSAILAGGLLAASLVAAAVDLSRRVQFDIPAQPLTTALLRFSEQASVQLAAPSELLAGLETKGVRGEHPTGEALGALLSGTGLTFQALDEQTVAIRPENSSRLNSTGDPAGVAGGTAAMSRDPPSDRLLVSQAEEQTAKQKEENKRASAASELQPVSPPDRTELGEIVVTGTHIRGTQSAGSKVIVIDRAYIDRSGYATTQEVLRTLPQNFGGGISEDFNTDASAQNLNFGTAVNLRGLGGDSTLVLVNGRRQPSGGLNGAFVDISSIALSAIERIEVLADGASAIYGSDAVGGVVNIVLRKDFKGAETRLRFGTLDGDADESQISQLLGTKWADGGSAEGNVLVGYQYYKRNALGRATRPYTASDDLTRFGGSDFRSANSNPGNILDPNTFAPAFAIPAGQDGTSLTPSDLLPGVVNYHESSEQGDLLPEQEIQSAFLTASQALGERVELFADGRYGTRDTRQSISGLSSLLDVPASNPFFVDPFGGSASVLVAYNFLDDLGPITGTSTTDTFAGTLGTILDLGKSWQTAVAVSYGDEETHFKNVNLVNFGALFGALGSPDPSVAFNPFGDGSHTNPTTLETIRGSQDNRARSRVWAANVTADGPILDLPGGVARLAVGADYRDEELTTRLTSSLFPQEFGVTAGRQVPAAFAEFSLPFVSSANARAGIQRLELSLAGRYEDYSDFGSTFDPRAGLHWAPSESLKLRGTWGTSFKAPRLGDLSEDPGASAANAIFPTFVPDPQSPFGFSPVLVRLGNNDELKPETATTWTAGLDFTPRAMPKLTLSATYYDIDYQDRIAIGGPPQNPLAVLEQEEIWADIIVRDPSQSEVEALCNSPLFLGDVATCLASQPAAILDLRWRNLAAVRTNGIDFDAGYSADTTWGNIGFNIGGTNVLSFEQAVSGNAPEVDLVDTVLNVPELRLRGGFSWSYKGFGANVAVNYTDSMDDNLSVPNRRIDSWTTVDLAVKYGRSSAHRWLDGLEFGVNVVNVFDEDPPFANVGFVGQAFGYDPANTDPFGRLISAHVVANW